MHFTYSTVAFQMCEILPHRDHTRMCTHTETGSVPELTSQGYSAILPAQGTESRSRSRASCHDTPRSWYREMPVTSPVLDNEECDAKPISHKHLPHCLEGDVGHLQGKQLEFRASLLIFVSLVTSTVPGTEQIIQRLH